MRLTTDAIDSFVDVAGVFVNVVLVYVAFQALSTWRSEVDYSHVADLRRKAQDAILDVREAFLECFSTRYVVGETVPDKYKDFVKSPEEFELFWMTYYSLEVLRVFDDSAAALRRPIFLLDDPLRAEYIETLDELCSLKSKVHSSVELIVIAKLKVRSDPATLSADEIQRFSDFLSDKSVGERTLVRKRTERMYDILSTLSIA